MLDLFKANPKWWSYNLLATWLVSHAWTDRKRVANIRLSEMGIHQLIVTTDNPGNDSIDRLRSIVRDRASSESTGSLGSWKCLRSPDDSTRDTRCISARTRRGYRGRRIAFDTEEPKWSSKTCRQGSGGYLSTKIEIPLATFSPRLFLRSSPPCPWFHAIILLGDTWTRTSHDWLPAYFRSGSERGVRLTTALFKYRRAGNKGCDNEINGW